MIILKTKEEIDILRAGGKKLAEIMDELARAVKPGITTGDLEEMILELMKRAGGTPAFKGYKPKSEKNAFPTALCASINNEVVHAPAYPARELKEGDIIGLDAGLKYKDLYTDMAVTVGVGEIDKKAKKLIETAKNSLYLAIKEVKPGSTLNDIGRAIQEYTEAQGFSVVRDLVGHGVGKYVHEEPNIFNYAVEGAGEAKLKEGMVIAIEPMINIGSYDIETAPDGFTIITSDNSLSAHWEHTVAVVEGGCDILTKI